MYELIYFTWHNAADSLIDALAKYNARRMSWMKLLFQIASFRGHKLLARYFYNAFAEEHAKHRAIKDISLPTLINIRASRGICETYSAPDYLIYFAGKYAHYDIMLFLMRVYEENTIRAYLTDDAIKFCVAHGLAMEKYAVQELCAQNRFDVINYIQEYAR